MILFLQSDSPCLPAPKKSKTQADDTGNKVLNPTAFCGQIIRHIFSILKIKIISQLKIEDY